jgi:transglutaminase-like putative cysteine protease
VLLARATGITARWVRGAIAFIAGATAGAFEYAAAWLGRARARNGLLVRPGSTAGMAMWVMVMLVSYLLLYYL